MSIINRQNGKKDEKLIFIYFSKKFQLENKTKFIKKTTIKKKSKKKKRDKTKKKNRKTLFN